MRIGVNVTSLKPLGGVEMSTFQVTRELARRGHDLHMFHQFDGEMREDYLDYGARVERVPSLFFEPKHALRDLTRFIPPARSFRREHGDVVWLNRYEQIFWGQAVARGARAALVCHLRHFPAYNRNHLLAHGVNHFIAISEFMRETWIAAGIEPERITVAHNAIRAEDYPVGGLAERSVARKELGLPDDAYVVLYYGRIDPEKGVDMLLDAWRTAELPADAHLLIVGESVGDPDPLREAALRESVDPATSTWLPMRLDVIPVLHAADVVVVPSQWDEPFGRVVIEGMLTGRPVVATRVGGIPEILRGPMDEFLVDRTDVRGLAGQLERLATWRTDRSSLGEECTAWVESHFSFSGLVDTVEATLRTATRDKRGTFRL